jgi:hypothetical protein
MSWSFRARAALNPAPCPPRRRVRPTLEGLEDRLVPSTFFVVDSGHADGTSSFDSLQTALGAAHAGDTVQIETSASGGSATVSTAVTIQGDPAALPGELPQFNLSLTASGVTLAKLNLGSVALANGATGETIQDSLVYGSSAGYGIAETAGGQANGGNLIRDNTFVTTAASSPADVILGNGGSGGAFDDQVVDNNFTSSVATSGFTGAGAFVAASGMKAGTWTGGGLSVRGNLFVDTDTFLPSVAVRLAGDGDVLTFSTVSGNDVRLAGNAASAAVQITDGPAGGTTAVDLEDNTLGTGGRGLGVTTIKADPTTTLQVRLAGNDFRGDATGLRVVGTGVGTSSDLGVIDAGGGPLGSAGGNDFRVTALGSTVMVVDRGGPLVGAVVAARNNILPTGASPASADVSSPMTGLAALLQEEFHAYLGRSPSAAELASYTPVYNGGAGAQAVANEVTRSTEHANYLVGQLYRELLGRTVDTSGLAYWSGQLQGGATEEQVIAGIVSSNEYQRRAAAGSSSDANTAYIQALYRDLLGRTASDAEVSTWQGVLQSQGASAVAQGFTGSGEFRADQVAAYYGQPAVGALRPANLLDRSDAPSSDEVAGWVNSGQDLLTMQAAFLASQEFTGVASN